MSTNPSTAPSPADNKDSATPGTETPPTVSLLVTFDIGQTFIFKSTGTGRKNVAEQWAEVFSRHPHGQYWSTEQWEGFKKPMGWIATWRYFGGSQTPELDAAIEQLRESVPGDLEEDKDAIRAIVFPNGIGVMIVRSRAAPGSSLDELDEILKEPAKREDRRDASTALLSWAGRCYMRFMEDARFSLNNGASTIVPVPAIRRTHDILRTAYTYPVFFFDKPNVESYCQASAADVSTYDGAILNTGWSKCIIARAEGKDHRAELERDLAIGLASWFALHVMTQRSTQYIRDTIHALATDQRHPSSMNARTIRLAYTEAANQALPIQWTSGERDLFLLEAIHRCWVSERWWRIVEQKTTLLAEHWEQEASDSDERWNRRITAFGAAIACFTLASAVADLLSLQIDPPGTGGSMNGVEALLIHFRILIGFVVPLVLGVTFVWIVLSRMSSRTPSR